MINVINSTFSNTTCGTAQCESSLLTWVMMAMMILDYILSLPTVSWALWILIRNSALGTEVFIFNILCADMMGTLTSSIMFLMMLVSSYMSTFIKGVLYINNLYLYGYPLFQCAMCFDRYMAVVHPITYLKYKVMRYKLTCLLLTWMVTLVMIVINTAFLNSQLLFVILVLVVGSQTFFSFSILKVLKRSRPGDRKRQQENEKKKRAFIIVVVNQVKLLINYMPYIVMSTFQGELSGNIYYCFIQFFIINICCFGHFFQAFLYLQRAGKCSVPEMIRASTCFR
ncbi:P2Y purinoceptor 8-like [Tachysurus ichikawai]